MDDEDAGDAEDDNDEEGINDEEIAQGRANLCFSVSLVALLIAI